MSTIPCRSRHPGPTRWNCEMLDPEHPGDHRAGNVVWPRGGRRLAAVAAVAGDVQYSVMNISTATRETLDQAAMTVRLAEQIRELADIGVLLHEALARYAAAQVDLSRRVDLFLGVSPYGGD